MDALNIKLYLATFNYHCSELYNSYGIVISFMEYTDAPLAQSFELHLILLDYQKTLQ